MKIKFRDIHLSLRNLDRLDQINSIIEEYQADGYVLTLRQLYYQLVTRDVIPNQQKEYSKLSTLLKEGRMAGIVDWEAIEDRLRRPSRPAAWNSPKDILKVCIDQYERPRQKGQPMYLEVWVEKDALSGVLSRVTERYHVPIMVNRGYSSVSAMHDAYERFDAAWGRGQQVQIIYLGDYDPSGIDMIRDIRARIIEFGMGDHPVCDDEGEFLTDYPFSVQPIALTRDQIQMYNPPPNPAKMSDPRASKFIKAHGKTSWEVDALRPDVLNEILDDAITGWMDMALYNSIVESEDADISKLKALIRLL